MTVDMNPWASELAADQARLAALATNIPPPTKLPNFIGESSDGLPVVVARKKRTDSASTSPLVSSAPPLITNALPKSNVIYSNLNDVAPALAASQSAAAAREEEQVRELHRLAHLDARARMSGQLSSAENGVGVAVSSSSSSAAFAATSSGAATTVVEKVLCQACSSPFSLSDVIFLEACGHSFCAMCVRKPVVASIKQRRVIALKCPLAGGGCDKSPAVAELKLILSEKEMDAFERLSVREMLTQSDNFVACANPKCDNVMERLAMGDFKPNKKEKGADGKLVPAELQRHKAEHRFRCPECTTDFCSSCHVTPYHEGRTCEQQAQFKAAAHCRFCGDVIKKQLKSKHAVFQDVCGGKDCMAKKSLSCTKPLACGHACCGIRDEVQCLDCLQCAPRPGATQSGEDFCPICYVEDLKSAPSIKLACGHVFHFECIRRKVAAGWPSSRITFTFLECPLCAQHVSHTSLAKLTAPHVALFDVVRQKALERLDVMKEHNAKELTESTSDYYRKPDKYAMARYCYYPCFKCKKPYYGGEKACGAPVQAEDFNPKDLICGSCSTGKNETCRKHGKEYIEYKCKFCCKVACFFCWGTTHFCEDCHVIAPKIAKYPLDQLPKCVCGVPHPPNGTEFCLGCAMCRLVEKRK
jgi:hypothetical protein